MNSQGPFGVKRQHGGLVGICQQLSRFAVMLAVGILAIVAVAIYAPTATAATAALSVDRDSIDVSETVEIAFDAGESVNPKNWVGVFPGGTKPGAGTSSIDWRYVPEQSGSLVWGPAAREGWTQEATSVGAGQYDLYLLEKDGYKALAGPVRVTITDEPEAPAVGLSVDRDSIDVTETVEIAFSAGESVNSKNWVGVFPGGTKPGTGTSSIDWRYVPEQSGSLVWGPAAREGWTQEATSVGVGQYDLYLLEKDGYKALAGPVRVTVTDNATTPAVPKPEEDGVSELNVLTLNGWNGGTKVAEGYKQIADIITQTDADLVFIPEVGKIPEQAGAILGYQFLITTNNTGILSRYPIVSTAVVADRWSKAILDVNGVEVAAYGGHLEYRWYATHLPRGYGGYTLGDWPAGWASWDKLPAPVTDVEQILAANLQSGRPNNATQLLEDVAIEAAAGRLAIVGGDYNEPSAQDWTEATADTQDHNGVVVPWQTTQRLIDGGLVDAYRAVYPDPVANPGTTWPASNPLFAPSELTWAAEADERDRIDYVFFSPDERLAVNDAMVVGPQASIVRSQSVEDDSEDTIFTPDVVWPSDHKGVLASFDVCADGCPEVPNPGTTDPVIRLGKAEVNAGGTVSVTGTRFEPDTQLSLELRPGAVALGAATTNGAGTFSTTVTVPRDTAVGEHTLVAVSEDGDLAAVNLQVKEAGVEADITIIQERLQEYFLEQGDEIIIANGIYLARTSEAMDYVASMNADGSWSDINYADRTSSANGAVWSAYIALYRMLALTQAYRDPDAVGFEDPAVLDAIERSLLYWDKANPGNTNWWETEVGESIAMGRISIFLNDVLSADALRVALKHNTGRLDPVGANGAWRTTNYLYRALSEKNTDAIKRGFDTIVETVAVDNSGGINEAVQPDSSFWAHEAQLYSEGYGMVLFTYAALWADVSRGTSLAFSRDHLDTIAFYIIDGTRWLIRGEIGMLYLNYRPPKTIQGVTSHASEFIEPLARMVRTDPVYSTAYQAVLEGIKGETRTNGAEGHKYFWRSEFSSHIRPDYGIFTRLNSNRTVGSEYRSTFRPEVGSEVVWNASGATAIQVNNREYLDLGPAFDWFHYPGVTAPYTKDQNRTHRQRNNASFVGGVTVGTYGANVFSLDFRSTKAKKSYFYFDQEMVAVGSDITGTAEAPVHTTVNQAVAKPNATINGEPLAKGTDSEVRDDVSWAFNDEVGYVFPSPGGLSVSNKPQTGNWIDQDPVTRDTFTLHFDHGVKPTGGEYEYIVLPAASPETVEAYSKAPAVEILRNDAQVQAATHAELGRTMATFYQAGVLDLGDGRSLEVNQPALVILDESGDVPVVSVANPSIPNGVVTVTVVDADARYQGIFTLGSGATLGKTVTAALEEFAGEQGTCAASSSAEGTGAMLACDGDEETAWIAGESGTAWLSAMLVPGSYVTGARIVWGDNPASKYLVQTSVDGKNWSDHQLIQGSGEAESQFALPPTAATYMRLLLLEGANEGGVSIAEFVPETTVNLALGRDVSASGGEAMSSVTDGSMDTRWKANMSDTAWIQVDLGEVRHVETVRLWWEASFAKEYRLQVSADGNSWKDVYTTPSSGSDGGADTITMSEDARYVRMQSQKRSTTQYGISMWEFEVFGDTLIADAEDVVVGRENLALKKPIKADSEYSKDLAATAANDGNPGTRWASLRQDAPYTTKRWLEVDLGGVKTVNQAVITWEGATSNDFEVQGSLDGSDWQTLARVQKTSAELRNVIDFASADARYVRVIGLPATKYGLSIFEFEVYGGFNLTCDAPLTSFDRNGSGVLKAAVTPYLETDTFSAAPLSNSVVTGVGDVRVTDEGMIEFDVSTGDSGSTQVLISHSDGDEFVWCGVDISVDTSQLKAQIDRANAMDSREYTHSSWQPVLVALSKAKDTLKTSGVSQSSVDAAATQLRNALDSVERVPVDPEFDVPGVPGGVEFTVVDGVVTVWWVAPESDGGSAVTGYEVRLGDLVQTVGGDVFEASFTDVPQGLYALTVKAGNEYGWSEASDSVTVEVSRELPPEFDVPGVPGGVEFTVVDGVVTVWWVAPESDGGSAVTGYEVRLGDLVQIVGGDVFEASFTDVPQGLYALTVKAGNEYGWSEASDSVTVEVSRELPPGPQPSTPRLSVVGTLLPGGKITIAGSGFASTEEHSLELRSKPRHLGNVHPAADGTFSMEATLPADVEKGMHSVVITKDGTDVASVQIQIGSLPGPGVDPGEGPGTTEPGPGKVSQKELSATGSDSLAVSLAAVMTLIVAGAALLLAGRRHR